MIKNILKNSFPVEYGLNYNQVLIPVETKHEPFELSDNKACLNCYRNPSRADRVNCNRSILKVNNNGSAIDVVNFENYIQQFEHTNANIQDRCDIIMTDHGMAHEKIVFCDLCCCEEKYVEPNNGNAYPEGKRAKARQQMVKSIDVLIQESVTAVNLLTYPEKICLFAWRDYSMPNKPIKATRGNPINNMQALLTSACTMATQTTYHYQQLGYGFKFIQIKYPSTYNW